MKFGSCIHEHLYLYLTMADISVQGSGLLATLPGRLIDVTDVLWVISGTEDEEVNDGCI